MPRSLAGDLTDPEMAQPYMKKDDDDSDIEYSPFFGIEKGAVLQEARAFHDPQLDARRCSQVITKLLYLINQGESFTKVEATEVFFAVTKLFQSNDAGLRRLVYLMIKELSPSSDEVFIVTSSLMKDMNSKTDMYRANAIRVLCRIIDGNLLTQIERYLKQAIVDKNPVVASAALVSGIHLLQANPEIVKRWSNEVQEAVQSRAALVQFHGLALLHQTRQNDRLAVSKLVSSLTRGSVRSPLAQCLLIRYTSQVIRESSNTQSGDRPFFDYLESCLRHKAEMVILEAARKITEMDVTSRELAPAITVLQLFLSSSKPVLRFAAVRTLNKVAITRPLAVTNCNVDLESLMSDQNRSIATLAITTLLKTGNESSVDRLMKQITSFMSDISDEFKIVVIEAIRSLCLKFPLKYRSMMIFLSNSLREEGGFEYKKAIVDSIVTLIGAIPDAKEIGLLHLCEFIEDCEFTYLSSQVDTSSGEADEDGVEDEYQLEDLEIVSADYMLRVAVSNFRNAWENMDPESERVDEYGLGARESLAEAVSAVTSILGMQPCEGTEVVPSNARSHVCLLSGVYIGGVKVLVRLSLGLSGPKEVAMKLAVRSDDPEVSDKIHEIVASG
ncbi:hypothetical protein CFC21_062411 [Triticum aestivum]|uniref:Coatomer subunit gamma n=2 Tax=Triticum aestivum TaxID=4565 RepID=A0A3B6JLA4_WHEAT|nr:coatomer subunit gamma-1-like [Triticum aestivum]KAF7054789.1 hypothetical protein CFC21_062411 [Triticum aestivum]